jgi:murein L,D-transpeptidase YafK
MRIRVLTGLVVIFLLKSSLPQTPAQPLHADRVVVLKKAHTLQLLSDGRVIKTYNVALGGDPVGPKTRQGDHKTPEGLYVLDSRNAHSLFYKSIHIRIRA